MDEHKTKTGSGSVSVPDYCLFLLKTDPLLKSPTWKWTSSTQHGLRTKKFSSVGCNCNGVKGTSELEQQWCISCGVIQPTPTVRLCRGFWLPLVSPRAHCRLEWWRPSQRGHAHPALLWLFTPGVSGRFQRDVKDRGIHFTHLVMWYFLVKFCTLMKEE